MIVIDNNSPIIGDADVRVFKYCKPEKKEGNIWVNPHFLPVSKDAEYDVAISTKQEGRLYVIAASTSGIATRQSYYEEDCCVAEKQVALAISRGFSEDDVIAQAMMWTMEDGALDLDTTGYFSVFEVTGFDEDGNMILVPLEEYHHLYLTLETYWPRY